MASRCANARGGRIAFTGNLEKPPTLVIPAQAGIHLAFRNSNMDPGFRPLLSGEKRALQAGTAYASGFAVAVAPARLVFQAILKLHNRHSGESRNPVKYWREALLVSGFVRFARCTRLDPGIRRDDGESVHISREFPRTAVGFRRDDGLKSS